MPIRAVTFDCAGTLLRADWHPAKFARASAKAVGINLTDDSEQLYGQLYVKHIQAFHEANRLRNPALGLEFYRRVATEWLGHYGLESHVDKMLEQADALAYGSSSILFALYPDTLTALKLVRERGLPVAVVSNWDYTLTRVLQSFGIADEIQFWLASLEEGVEKPDPRLFHIALERLGLKPEEVLHVGDDFTDDVEGATAAGMKVTQIDRDGISDRPRLISSLLELSEVLDCYG